MVLFEKTGLLVLVALLALITFTSVSMAFNDEYAPSFGGGSYDPGDTTGPPVFGHSGDEINIFNPTGSLKTLQQAIDDGDFSGFSSLTGLTPIFVSDSDGPIANIYLKACTANGKVLKYNSGVWDCADDLTGSGTTCGEDQVLVGSSCVTLPSNCDSEFDTLNYDSVTNTFICNDDESGGGGGSTELVFKTIDAPSGSDPVADSSTDILKLIAGSNITITGNSTDDSVTIASTGSDLWTSGSGGIYYNSGSVSIGTSSLVGVPKLNVEASSSDSSFVGPVANFNNKRNATNENGIWVKTESTSSSTNIFQAVSGSSDTQRFAVKANGEVCIGTSCVTAWPSGGGGIGGSGSANFVPYFTGATTLANSGIAFDGASVGIGTTTPASILDVRGNEVRIWDGTGTVSYATGSGELYVDNDLEVDGTLYVNELKPDTGENCAANDTLRKVADNNWQCNKPGFQCSSIVTSFSSPNDAYADCDAAPGDKSLTGGGVKAISGTVSYIESYPDYTENRWVGDIATSGSATGEVYALCCEVVWE